MKVSKKHDGALGKKDSANLFPLYSLALGSDYLRDSPKLTGGSKKGSEKTMAATIAPTRSPRDPVFLAHKSEREGRTE